MVFLLSLEARRPRADGKTMKCNSTMEHSAAIIICRKNPNVSKSGVSRKTKIWGPGTYQDIYRTEVNQRKDSEDLEWSK